MVSAENVGQQFSYRDQHTPNEGGAPLHDLTGSGEYYPADVYSPKGKHYYAGHSKTAEASWSTAIGYKGQPNKPVTIYRAVPKHVSDINPGDWVSINKDYATQHGESRFEGNYRLLSKTVPASHVRTPADDINEWGYYPH